MLKDDILFCMKDQANRHMFNISEIIVAPRAIMLLTNRDIGDKRAPRRDGSSTLQKIVPGWVNCESGFSSFTLRAHTRTHAYSASRVQTSLFFFSPLSVPWVADQVGALCEPDIRHTTRSVGWDGGVGRG